MSGWKRSLLMGAGYLAAFTIVFIVSAYLTFDANALKPMLIKEAARRQLTLEIREMDLAGFMGMELKGLKITGPKVAGQEGSAPSPQEKSDTPRFSSRQEPREPIFDVMTAQGRLGPRAVV